MRDNLKKPWFVFVMAFLAFTLPLCLLPINLFPGEIIVREGLVETTIQAPLSLSYFLGLGYSEEDMIDIVDFYLLPQGYILAVLFTVGIPALIALRMHYGKGRKKDSGTKGDGALDA